MAITKLIWIALPNGLEDNGQTLRLSVYLAPWLVAEPGTTVAQFPPFNAWPSTAAGIKFQVSFDNGLSWSEPPLSAVYDQNNQLDTELWTAIFGGEVAVGEHKPLTLPQGIESHDAGKNYRTIHEHYIPDPSELPHGRGGNKLARLAARLLPSAGIATDEQRAWAQFLNFHRPRSTASLRPKADDPTPNIHALDFHTAVSALSRYPAAMRALGLVFDLKLLRPAGLPLTGHTVRTRPVVSSDFPDWQMLYPNTAYSLDEGLFTLEPALKDDINYQLFSGMLFSDGSELIPIDVDALGLAINTALSRAPQAAQAMPTRRNAGFSLTLPDLDKRLKAQIDSGNAVWDGFSKDDDLNYHGETLPGHDDLVVFHAEDLIRGYRVDIRTLEQNQWRSLCRRRVTFYFGSSSRQWDKDEGLIGLGLTVGDPDEPHQLSPMQVRWQGWSLCAPRPGKCIGPDGGAVDQNLVCQALLPFTATIEPVPGSLPRLRFNGEYYQFRTVDLAGNSLAFDAQISENFAMPAYDPFDNVIHARKYLRVDPLLAPVMLLRDAPGPGESVERLVIVSDFDQLTAKNCERLIAMPKASVQTAEWHGMFDTDSGVKGDEDTWKIVIKNNSILCGKNSGSFPDAFYGNNPPDLPYLPDPLAGGASFFSISDSPPSPGISCSRASGFCCSRTAEALCELAKLCPVSTTFSGSGIW